MPVLKGSMSVEHCPLNVCEAAILREMEREGPGIARVPRRHLLGNDSADGNVVGRMRGPGGTRRLFSAATQDMGVTAALSARVRADSCARRRMGEPSRIGGGS